MAAYTEEQFIYFTTKLNQLEYVKENKETYWGSAEIRVKIGHRLELTSIT
ncbi:hypothetical protein BPADB04_45890 [Bacillus paranthracis]|nr:hypothetical protein [Bacillus paranthracis]GIX59559.1 hypothetical protein BPADB04_45890 [Bacillus paranthracis]